ncbi:FAD dependent oxidoreductase family protein [Sphingomonas sp. S17]|uniref:Tryptophan 2-monooxygenase n=2 Tax=Sphingomonas paucimobilis TaxID=13689 RepID=A0A411LH83_SPHPI|nr:MULTISPECIES: NAD(P)/FAD-dependent oxidoreductase [Sphingomonas]EGI56207.1 FAD dependent oxidoreductase family protein [Sphingomonas sp. S17]MCM3677844.1 FAD-dependent oxidoreductase [Sphingomonas paucimobilis]MDG5972472.1 FAD-dependent oxidoreductase [Sphingomonas paucimobilis]NNG57551.1 FAD-dependent oxidoreductase [Sphingomonas paucimobilis]QBE91715.1 FAD-dependent oxidoreductase [Sphingomonas paucimobilis]
MTGRTVVIGGGAAGIAAARTLHDAGRDVLLIEAADRLGGRARSVCLPTGHIVDHGCGWLHSAKRNPWTAIAEQAGFTIDRRSPNWQVQWNDLGFPPDQKRASGEAYARFEEAAMAALDGPDRPLSGFVDKDDPWRPIIDAISGYANGASLAEVSLHDWAAYEKAATDDNWAVVEGYGTVIVNHAAGVPVRTSVTATRIDHRGQTIRIKTSAGMIEADHVIIAVPTTVLADGKLTFDPPLPAKQEAAAALPLGIADKVFLSVEGPLPWPAHAHLTGNPHSACTASHRLSPFGWPIVESFFGGPCAEALEDEGTAAQFAIDELVTLLGSDWRQRFTALGATRWRHVPLIGGSYSHARVGQAGARQILAEPVDGRIFFAGEACSHEDFSTAHGAYETGMEAAHAVMRADTHPRHV